MSERLINSLTNEINRLKHYEQLYKKEHELRIKLDINNQQLRKENKRLIENSKKRIIQSKPNTASVKLLRELG